MSKVFNFSAGPGILPAEVIKEASEAVINFNNLNLSLLELSHRSKDVVDMTEEARALAKELLGLGDDYVSLFLGGGASLQFAMVPYNFLTDKGACYTNTGTWAGNAIKEAKKLGKVNVLGSSEDKKFSYIPKGYHIPADADYFHITSNNTIYGTQVKDFPDSSIPVICDMSSDIFSRKLAASQFSLIYAGAQKNMGPAGTTLVIISKEMLERAKPDLLSMLDYNKHVAKDTMFNTPPVFPIYVSLLTMRWLKKNGGLEWIEKINEEKAKTLYDEIDRNPLFVGSAAKEDRSNMNVTFVPKEATLESNFLELAKAANLNGLKGHRSTGGFRASLYNAMDITGVKELVKVMKAFEAKFG